MDQQTPLVTIRCITYNHEPYIRQCLDGFVMQQTNFKFEAVVHDDASTDGTAAIIAEFAEKYPDIIKPLYETENQYSKKDGSIRRIMNAHMRGKYIAICEGDDYWTDPYKLQKQVDFLESNPDYGLCYTDFDIFDNIKTHTMTHSMIQSGQWPIILDFKTHLTKAGYIAPCSWLYRKEVYDKIINSNMLRGVTDGSFVVALEFFLHSKIAYLPFSSCVYRLTPGSATNKTNPKSRFIYIKGVFDIQRKYSKHLLNNESARILILRRAIYILRIAIKYKLVREVFSLVNVIHDVKYGEHRGVLYPLRYFCIVINVMMYFVVTRFFS